MPARLTGPPTLVLDFRPLESGCIHLEVSDHLTREVYGCAVLDGVWARGLAEGGVGSFWSIVTHLKCSVHTDQTTP